jgi:hypothetical protein
MAILTHNIAIHTPHVIVTLLFKKIPNCLATTLVENNKNNDPITLVPGVRGSQDVHGCWAASVGRLLRIQVPEDRWPGAHFLNTYTQYPKMLWQIFILRCWILYKTKNKTVSMWYWRIKSLDYTALKSLEKRNLYTLYPHEVVTNFRTKLILKIDSRAKCGGIFVADPSCRKSMSSPHTIASKAFRRSKALKILL